MTAGFDWRTPVSFLGALGEATRQQLLEGARRMAWPAGAVADYPTGTYLADVVEHGLVRAYQVSEDGRESSIAYAHPGEYIGALPAVVRPPAVFLQAVGETSLLRLNGDRLWELYRGNVEIAQALAVHTAAMLARVVRVVTVRTLGTVEEKLAFDLLERACAEQLRAGGLVFAVTHEELGQAIGASREAVSRIVGELRRARVIATAHGRIRVDDPGRLVDTVQGLVT